MVELYKEQVRTTGAFQFATSTRILKPRADRAYFHLVYGTRNRKGILEFRDVERKAAREQDVVRDSTKRRDREGRSGQVELDFGESVMPSRLLQEERTRQLAKAEEKLLQLLREGPVLFGELQPRILELPLVWDTDLDRLLVEGDRRGRFIIEGMGPRQRKPRLANIIRLA